MTAASANWVKSETKPTLAWRKCTSGKLSSTRIPINTMVLKQSRLQIRHFIFKHTKQDSSASFRIHVLMSSARSRVTAASPTAALAASSEYFKRSLRWRRAPAVNAVELRAVRHTALRDISTSLKVLQYDLKPDVPKIGGRRLFFDTHAVVRLLEENAFTTQQAEVMVQVLMRTTNSNMDVIYGDMVTKVQQEIMFQQVMSKIAAVKKDMVILEKSEFSALLAENEKLKTQLLQLKVQLADIMNKVRSDNILDMNLEKSCVKELKAEHEKKLLETRTEIMEMSAEQDRHFTQTIMKIDTEVAGLKTMLESHKLDTIKYLAGSVFTCLTVVLGFYRIWM